MIVDNQNWVIGGEYKLQGTLPDRVASDMVKTWKEAGYGHIGWTRKLPMVELDRGPFFMDVSPEVQQKFEIVDQKEAALHPVLRGFFGARADEKVTLARYYWQIHGAEGGLATPLFNIRNNPSGFMHNKSTSGDGIVFNRTRRLSTGRFASVPMQYRKVLKE
eukprot:gene22613-1350_t